MGQVLNLNRAKPKLTPPKRTPYNLVRTREYLTKDEVKAVIEASKHGRCGKRDALMLTICYHHALRVSELIDLQWSDIDFKAGTLYVRRLKGSTSNVQPMEREDIKALGKLERTGRWIFTAWGKGTLTRRAIHAIVSKAGKRAGISFPIHVPMLRHSAGFVMADKGIDTRRIQDKLGHKNINCTVRYTQLTPKSLIGLWD